MDIKKRLSDYYPGILLFLLALLLALFTYRDYGVAWDEPIQRDEGLLGYNYLASGNQELFTTPNDNHGTGFELLLIFIEKKLHLTDFRDIYLSRHIASHIFFLVSALCMYILVFRLFKSRVLASLGFVMLALAPRIYAHSFFNSKDVPFLAMFVMVFLVAQLAFEKKRPLLFLLLGILCGYATSIRIMGLMLWGVVLGFLLIDIVAALIQRTKLVPLVAGLLLFLAGSFVVVYFCWPYIQPAPLSRIVESYFALSHFDKWGGAILFKGEIITGTKIPLAYFPTWFLISNPLVWLVAGFGGMLWVVARLFRSPLSFLKNTPDRNFLFYLACFCVPVFAVIFLRSIIYDDWRHLYFVYPSFVLLALYFVQQVMNGKYKLIVLGACALQAGAAGYFLARNHPFGQVYFNPLVSHKPEYLRKNYDFEYWGCSMKQAMEHIAATDNRALIKIAWGMNPIPNNIFMLPKETRKRFDMAETGADYLITNYRLHPADFPLKEYYSIKVLNSTIVCVYKMN